MTKPTLLFVCTHNAGRSALGAALAREQAGDRAVAFSAGINPAETASAGTIASLAEIGIDDSAHLPSKITEELVRNATVVISMKPDSTCPTSTASPTRPGTCPTRKDGKPRPSVPYAITSVTGSGTCWSGSPRRSENWNPVHLVSTLGPSHPVLDGYPEAGSEGESLTTPSESVASGPKP